MPTEPGKTSYKMIDDSDKVFKFELILKTHTPDNERLLVEINKLLKTKFKNYKLSSTCYESENLKNSIE